MQENDKAVADFGENTQFYKETLEAHNELRALHNANALSLNLKLCQIAQDCANKYACDSSISSDVVNLIHEESLGENNAFQFSTSNELINGVVITRLWYNEIKNYDFSNPKFSPTSGHFTQLVWKSSTDVGFGRTKRLDNGSCYIVAKYYPSGNIEGEFKENVAPI